MSWDSSSIFLRLTFQVINEYRPNKSYEGERRPPTGARQGCHWAFRGDLSRARDNRIYVSDGGGTVQQHREISGGAGIVPRQVPTDDLSTGFGSFGNDGETLWQQ